jgi:transcriptional regulator with XRE-family HTH domain
MESTHPLQKYREEKGLSATDLAAKLGVQRNTLWRWENFRRAIKPEFWSRIHEETGIPIETLATARIEFTQAAE